jgi:hypothetical protein
MRYVPGIWLLVCLPAAAATPRLFIEETPNVRLLYYSPTHAYLVPHLLRSFENSLRFHRKLWDYQPDRKEKITILFNDFTDMVHGGATALPRNFLDIGIAPPNYVFETALANDRISLLMNHELTHIVTSDQARGADMFFRRFFRGKVTPVADDPVSMAFDFLTNPRHTAPRWYHEGLAVFMETWMGGGLGRALGGYDEMVFRAKVRDGSPLYDAVGLESEGTTIDFQVGANSYLYGTRFLTWMAANRGVPKLVEWGRRDAKSRSYFSSQFRQVYGRPLSHEWRNWIAAEREWQTANLAEIRRYPVTPLKRLTDTTLGSISRMYWDERERVLYAAVQYLGQVAHLAAIDPANGTIRKIVDLKGAALYYVCSLAWDPDTRTLFYTTDNKQWRDLNMVEPDTGRHRLLARDMRTGDLAFDRTAHVLWGIRRTDGYSSIVRIAPPYREWTEVRRCEYGHDLFDLDVSPDGKYLTAGETDLAGRQKLVRLATADPAAQTEVLHDFEFSSPANFVHSPDGRYLFGTSYFTGASNVFRYDTAARKMDVLSNAETGIFRPLPLAGGRLLALEYTASGFVPVEMPVAPVTDVSPVAYLGQQVAERWPVVKSWQLPSPQQIDLNSLGVRHGVYNPRALSLLSAYPIVQGYKNYGAGGWRVDLSDKALLSSLAATLTFSPGPERAHVGFQYRYWDWKVTGAYNNADFYDLFGPTKSSFKGYFLKVEKRRMLLYDSPRTLELEWNAAGYGGLERLPDYQNVAASSRNYLTGKLALNYSFVDRSLGAVDDEKGVRWQLALRNNYANGKELPRVYGTYDYGFLLPLKNSPVWLRTAAGYGFGNRNEPFANFYFGGFGNNYVDRLEASRYREFTSFPGMELDQVAAKGFGRALAEWNLPPVRFRHLGVPYLYCNWARLSLFGAGLATDGGRRYGDGGAQIDFRIVPMSYLNSTFSVGYAVSKGSDTRRHGELMISLKLL